MKHLTKRVQISSSEFSLAREAGMCIVPLCFPPLGWSSGAYALPSYLTYLWRRSSMVNSSISHSALLWIPLGWISKVYLSITPHKCQTLLRSTGQDVFSSTAKEEVRVAELIRVAHLNHLNPSPLSATTVGHVCVLSAIYTNTLPRRYFILHVPWTLWVLVKWNDILMLQQNRVRSHLSTLMWAGKGQLRW